MKVTAADFERFLQPVETAEQTADRERRQAEDAFQQRKLARSLSYQDVIRRRGARYGKCLLENFEISTPEQKKAVDQLSFYAFEMPSRSKDGGGVILLGPPGTGKDHLIAGLMAHATLRHGLSACWVSGEDLFGEIRDRMDGAGRESDFVKDLTAPSVLAISDPLPPSGPLTEFQTRMLFRIIDARYSRCRPTWVSMNVSSREEAEQRMGAQAVDRLVHGSLTLWCNWPSFRR